jgi:hypothetical protein
MLRETLGRALAADDVDVIELGDELGTVEACDIAVVPDELPRELSAAEVIRLDGPADIDLRDILEAIDRRRAAQR